jgi:hypothetical protein
LSAIPNLQHHELCSHADWPQLRRSNTAIPTACENTPPPVSTGVRVAFSQSGGISSPNAKIGTLIDVSSSR